MTTVLNFGAFSTEKPMVLYNNLFANGTLTASSGTGENAIDGNTWDFWSGTGASTLEVDLSTATRSDCAFIDAHNLATVSSDLTLDHWNGVAWVNIATVTPADDGAILIVFPPITATKYRIGATGADIGVAMIGERLIFPTGIDQNYTSIPHARVIEMIGGDSLSGQFLGSQITRKSASTSAVFPMLEAEWVDNDMAEFEAHYNEGKPFAFAGNPLKYPKDIGFCQRPMNAGELRPTYFEGGIYENFTMRLGVYQNV